MHDYFNTFYNAASLWAVFPTILITSLLIVFFAKQLVEVSREFLSFVLVAWFFRVLLAITAPLNGFFPSMGDNHVFSYMITNNELPQLISFPISVLSYFYLTFPIRVLSFFDIQAFLIYQQLFYFLSGLLLLKAAKLYFFNDKQHELGNFKYIFLTLFCLYPAGIIYTSVPLREVFVMFALSLTIYGFIINQIFKKYLLLIVGLVLLALLRRQFVAILLICWLAVKYYRHIWFYLLIPVIVAVSIFIFEVAMYEITPHRLARIRLAWSDAHGDQVYGLFNWITWFDLLRDYPSLILQYIMSPFPILHNLNPFSMKAAFVDSLYTIPVVMISVFMLMLKRYTISPFFILAMVFLCVSCVWEAYIGGAVRHRMTTVLPLIPLISLFISNLFATKRL